MSDRINLAELRHWSQSPAYSWSDTPPGVDPDSLLALIDAVEAAEELMVWLADRGILVPGRGILVPIPGLPVALARFDFGDQAP